MNPEEIQDNVFRVEERIKRACERARRDRREVQLIAVSKTFSPEHVRAALTAGVTVFGENRVQEAMEKFNAVALSLRNPPRAHPGESAARAFKLHLIGHLQSNKARPAAGIFDMIHTVDHLEVARKLSVYCEQLNRLLPILIQVNIENEETKSGVESRHVLELVQQVSLLKPLRIRGLMAIPPFTDHPEDSRSHFRSLRQLAEGIARARIENVSMHELSMGMSHDFEVAIEERATMIRVGTAIFGGRG
jgi:pyridoxal phosphate enzyme (YggS family)